MIALRDYQRDAVQKITSHFRLGNDRAFLIMPTGSGKTTLSLFAVEELSQFVEIKSVLFISSHRFLAEQYENYPIRNLSSKGFIGKLDSKTYKEVEMLFEMSQLDRAEYQVIIFDEAIREQVLLSELLEFFDAFKIVLFSRKPDDNVELIELEENLVFHYSLEQAIQENNFFESKRKYFDLLARNALEGSADSEDLKKDILELQEENEDLQKVARLIKDGKIKLSEVAEIKRKKESLEYFDRLLNDDSFFQKEQKNFHGPEAVWQAFFEENKWIFGFGLNYVFNSPLEGESLEQVVEGYSVRGHGKRIDALMHTNGLIQSLCFAEIKTHKKPILRQVVNAYRPDSWSISSELAGGIAQIQRTVQQSLTHLQTGLHRIGPDGCTTGEKLFLYKPKSFLIIGSLSEFKNEKGQVNESKYSSFQIFRSSISDVEIITFDELFGRAEALVNNNSSQ